jgi:type VI secretion system protein ImpA
MSTILDEKASEDPPSTSTVRDMVGHVVEIANRYAPAEEGAPAAEGGSEGAVSADGTPGVAMGGGVAGGISVPAGQVVSREDALRALENLATFFKKTEPVSPLAYTLEDAVRRSRLTWPELLEEIVTDRDSRNAILTALGIRPPPPPPEE